MSKCDSCKFRESSMFPWKCNYISIFGHSRGCEPGDLCTKYEKGDRIKSNLWSTYKKITYSDDKYD